MSAAFAGIPVSRGRMALAESNSVFIAFPFFISMFDRSQ
jgi:hypothetical protein